MPFSKEFHDALPLLHTPLSLNELAKAGDLPPVLHINDISLLMYPDAPGLQQVFQKILKNAIINNRLDVTTVAEYSQFTEEWEKSRDPKKYMEPPPPGQMPLMGAASVAYQDSDLFPGQESVDREQRRMLVVHKDDMRKYLEEENKWPLDKDVLLSRWWPEQPKGAKTSDTVENVFRLEGDSWRVRFRGKDLVIHQSVGIQYITHLIQRAYDDEPEIHVSELYYHVNGRPAVNDNVLSGLNYESLSKLGLDGSKLGDGLETMTLTGITCAKNQLRELAERISEAEERGNTREALQLRGIKEKLQDHLSKSLGLSGRQRKSSDPNEKMRNTVSKAIGNALTRLTKNDGAEFAVYLGDHLDRGLCCSFRKDPDINWKIEKTLPGT